MRVVNPPQVLAYVRDAYKRYYDSAFWMRDPGIMRERDEILAQPGVMAQEALLEAVPVYPSVKAIGDACREAGLSDFTASHLGPVIFGDEAIKLRDHQAKSLVTAHKGNFHGHRNVIVTSGTGSGKTESFLLPLLAGLLEERRQGMGTGSLHRWWENGLEGKQPIWKPMRDGFSGGPPAAVRALVLYPTNALVEDQVSRLEEWPTYREAVAQWLAGSPDVDAVISRLSAFAPLSSNTKVEIATHLKEHLVAKIDEVAQDSRFIQRELSHRLAVAGLLPMFGFPTQVRTLYSDKKATKVEKVALSDRPLDHAVWAFSPGSEVPKDKQLHVACGFVSKYDSPQGVKNEEDPLGAPLPYSRCVDDECGAITHGSTETCKVCGNPSRDFKLYQPKGFMAHWRALDYDGQRSRGPALPPPVMAFDQAYGDHRCGPLEMAIGTGPVTIVNDNDNNLFEFHAKEPNMVVVNDTALYRDDRIPGELPSNAISENPYGAIGAIFTTDVLSFYFDNAPGVGNHGLLESGMPSTTPALASFAEFAKLAIATELDISPDEFRVGRQPMAIPDKGKTEQVFLADALENGAGYARWASDPANFSRALSRFYTDTSEQWNRSFHAENCDRSCPDCLRSYSNRFSHGLLDWRLALDLAELTLGLPIDTGRWIDGAEARIASAFAAFCAKSRLKVGVEEHAGLSVIHRDGRALVLGHPLWHSALGLVQPVQLDAHESFRAAHGADSETRFVDVRHLAIRFPEYMLAMK